MGSLRPVVVLFGLATAAMAAPCEAARLLVIGSIEVRETKKDGRSSWDPGKGKPDLVVSIERTSAPAGEKHITAPRKDVFKTDFNRPAIEVDANDVLKIRVLDSDLGGDDQIGEISRKFSSEELKSGKLELSFGQVKHLILRFER